MPGSLLFLDASKIKHLHDAPVNASMLLEIERHHCYNSFQETCECYSVMAQPNPVTENGAGKFQAAGHAAVCTWLEQKR